MSSYYGTQAPAKAKKSHGDGSFLGNLLKDATDTAKGIGPGMAMFAEHPIRTAKQSAKMTAHEYAPLVHGHYGEFWHSVHQHPLQPILDAVSIAALVAGGAGAGIKAGATGAEEGTLAARLAEHVTAGTKYTQKALPTKVPGHNEYVHYSRNIFRRAMLQKPFEHALTAAGKVPGGKAMFGKGGVYDYTPLGRGERKLAQRASEHRAGASFMQQREVIAARRIAKNAPNVTGEQFAHAIYPSIEKSLKDHALKVPYSKAGEIPTDSPWGYIPARKKAPIFPKSTHPDDVAEWAKNLGAHWKGTRDPGQALADADGNLMLVHRDIPKSIGKETDNTYRAVHAIYNKPTRVWKWLVLANAPRYFVNNLVGQSLMLSMAHSPVAVSKGIFQAISDVQGVKAAERSARRMNDHLSAESQRLAGTWQHKWYAGPHTGAFGELRNAGKKSGHISSGLYGVTDKVSYRGHRMVGINVAMMEHPVFQKFFRQLRDNGIGRTEAFRRAADKASERSDVRSYVEKRSSDWAGQYHHSNSLENMIRHIVPFYSWDRHALRFGKEQVLERPGSTAALASLGMNGHEHVKQVLGDLPDFMEGAIPALGKHTGILGDILGGPHVGRKKVVLTSGINPLAAAADDVQGMASLVGGKRPAENVGRQLNPLITGFISGMTGQNAVTGARVHHHGGPVGSALAESFGNIPQLQLLKTLMHGDPKTVTKRGKPKLYTHDLRTQLASLLGVPVRDFSPAAAESLFREQEHLKKGRSTKHRGSSYYTK